MALKTMQQEERVVAVNRVTKLLKVDVVFVSQRNGRVGFGTVKLQKFQKNHAKQYLRKT